MSETDQRMIECQHLKKTLPALTQQPYPGPLGEKIYDHISQEAWEIWLAQQTMLINENRLSPLDPDARTFLEGQMQTFLFEGETEKPQGFVEA